MHRVIMGRPSALLELEIDVGDEPIKVFDINNRVGGDTYWWFLRRSSPAKILTPHQSVFLFRSFGVPLDDAWRLLDASVEALKHRLPECVTLMEKCSIFTPNFGWRFANFPRVAVFLAAETLPDEFWWRLDQSGGTYWVIGDPYSVLHDRVGYSRLKAGENLLRVPETIHPLVQHMIMGHGTEPGGPVVYQSEDIHEVGEYFDSIGERLTIVTFKNKELADLPDWVERPLFMKKNDPVFLRTMADRHYTGDNAVWERILRALWREDELDNLVAPSTTDVNLREVTPDTPMSGIYGDDRVAELTVGEYAQKPWKYRYSKGAKCVARSAFALTSANNVAYYVGGPWKEELRYKASIAALKTLTLLK